MMQFRKFWERRKGKMILSQKEPDEFGKAITLLFELRAELKEVQDRK